MEAWKSSMSALQGLYSMLVLFKSISIEGKEWNISWEISVYDLWDFNFMILRFYAFFFIIVWSEIGAKMQNEQPLDQKSISLNQFFNLFDQFKSSLISLLNRRVSLRNCSISLESHQISSYSLFNRCMSLICRRASLLSRWIGSVSWWINFFYHCNYLTNRRDFLTKTLC